MTVDIAALREECVRWVNEALPGLVDTRQPKNGDSGDFMSWDMAVIFKTWTHLSSKLEAAQARIAELESKQEPVAWISERNLANLGKHFSVYVKHEPVMVRPVALYTTPPKPVVKLQELPAAIGDHTASAMKAVRRMDIQSIKAAGIIVEGE